LLQYSLRPVFFSKYALQLLRLLDRLPFIADDVSRCCPSSNRPAFSCSHQVSVSNPAFMEAFRSERHMLQARLLFFRSAAMVSYAVKLTVFISTFSNFWTGRALIYSTATRSKPLR
jgi:hypothetical protein